MIKIFLYILIILLASLYSKNKNKLLLFNIILILSISFSLREILFENIGADYYDYKEWFDLVTFKFIILRLKRGIINDTAFNIVISICKLLFNNFYFFLFICGVIINSIVFNFIDKYSENFLVSSIVYMGIIYFSTFNITRQWIACAICIYAMKFILEKKIYKYIIFIGIASLFHTSSLPLILLYPLVNSNIKYKFKILIIVIFSIILIMSDAQNLILNKLSFLSYDKYLNYTKGTGNFKISIISIVNLILINLPIKKMKISKKQIENISILLIITTAFSILGTKYFIFNRFSIYFIPTLIISFPMVLNIFESKSKNIIKMLLIIIFYIAYL